MFFNVFKCLDTHQKLRETMQLFNSLHDKLIYTDKHGIIKVSLLQRHHCSGRERKWKGKLPLTNVCR
jgi:hypothetical protein